MSDDDISPVPSAQASEGYAQLFGGAVTVEAMALGVMALPWRQGLRAWS